MGSTRTRIPIPRFLHVIFWASWGALLAGVVARRVIHGDLARVLGLSFFGIFLVLGLTFGALARRRRLRQPKPS
ncbi:MAG TPA: hypothetical protein VGA62_03475 [Acidimicrobiia bacterium]